MARAATNQAGAVWLMDQGAADAVFVCHGLLDRVRAACDGRTEPAYGYAAKAAWRFLDSLVGRLADAAGPEALVLVVSPGWRGGAGVLLAAGPTAPQAPDFLGADLLDIAPTVLAHFGLQDATLAGRALAPLVSPTALAPAPAPTLAERVLPDQELLRVAADAGYPPPAPPPAAWQAQGLAELGFMLLRRDPEAAATAAAEALRLHPQNVLALRIRATALFALERADELFEIAERLDHAAPDRGWGALARGAHHVLKQERARAAPWLTQAERDPEPETLLTVAAAWLMIDRTAAADRVFQAVLTIDPANTGAEIGLAITALQRRQFVVADQALRRAIAQDPGRLAIYETMAKVYHASGQQELAARARKMAQRLGGAS